MANREERLEAEPGARAVVIATGHSPGTSPFDEHMPSPLLPLVDRPFIQHVVETLVGQGFTSIDFVLSHLPEKIESYLGDGTRWGGSFTYHLARDPVRPYGQLRTMGLGVGAPPFLLVHGDRLPLVDLSREAIGGPRPLPVLVCRQRVAGFTASEKESWTGWAWLSGDVVAGVPGDADEGELEAYLLHLARRSDGHVRTPVCLSSRSPEDLLASHARVLRKEFTGLFLTGRETEPGIWLSRNVSLHPSARLTAPVYIAESCRVGAGVQLGPNAAIGHGCVLDAGCTIADSVVFPGSYVGERLELNDVVVDRNRLVDVRVGATVSVADEFILGSLSAKPLWDTLPARVLTRTLAILLLLLAWPLVAVGAGLALLRGRPIVRRREALRLPTTSDPGRWRTTTLYSLEGPDRVPTRRRGVGWRDVLLRFVPGLLNVARGDLRFVGVQPRSREEVARLPRDWRALYVRAKAGLVTEADLLYDGRATDDELYSAEAVYSVTAGPWHDTKLLLVYLARSIGLPVELGGT